MWHSYYYFGDLVSVSSVEETGDPFHYLDFSLVCDQVQSTSDDMILDVTFYITTFYYLIVKGDWYYDANTRSSTTYLLSYNIILTTDSLFYIQVVRVSVHDVSCHDD